MKRLIIAEAIVKGARIASVARRIGVSRSWASREANAPETRLVMSALLKENAGAISQLLDTALTTIEEELEATKVIRSHDGRRFEVPDHRIRLEAVGLFIRLMSASAMGWASRRPRHAGTTGTRSVSTARPLSENYMKRISFRTVSGGRTTRRGLWRFVCSSGCSG